MAKRKISDALRSLNARYDADLKYQEFWNAVASGRVPAERDPSERFWLIDEDDEPRIAEVFGLVPVEVEPEPAATAAAKPRPARPAAW